MELDVRLERLPLIQRENRIPFQITQPSGKLSFSSNFLKCEGMLSLKHLYVSCFPRGLIIFATQLGMLKDPLIMLQSQEASASAGALTTKKWHRGINGWCSSCGWRWSDSYRWRLSGNSGVIINNVFNNFIIIFSLRLLVHFGFGQFVRSVLESREREISFKITG